MFITIIISFINQNDVISAYRLIKNYQLIYTDINDCFVYENVSQSIFILGKTQCAVEDLANSIQICNSSATIMPTQQIEDIDICNTCMPITPGELICGEINGTIESLECNDTYLLYNGTCLTQCPQNTTIVDWNVCINCTDDCGICSKNNTGCMVCNDGFLLFNMNNMNTCIITCPCNYFQYESSCIPCIDQKCKFCNGPDGLLCNECIDDYVNIRGGCFPLGIYVDDSTIFVDPIEEINLPVPNFAQDLRSISFDFCIYVPTILPNKTYLMITFGNYLILYKSETGIFLNTTPSGYIITLTPPIILNQKQWNHLSFSINDYGNDLFFVETIATNYINYTLYSRTASGYINQELRLNSIILPGTENSSGYTSINALFSNIRVWNGTVDFSFLDLAFRYLII